MFSFIVASGSTTRRSLSIFRQLSTSSFFTPIFKRQQSIRIDKNNKAIFHDSRNRAKVIPTVATRLFSRAITCDNHFRFPPLTGNILVVGDGDFSYSVALAKENKARGGNAKITASSLDTKYFIEETYSVGKANLEILSIDSNVELKHEMDVTENGSCGNDKVWDSIVWNFPYPANCIHFSNATIEEGSALLVEFFQNLTRSMKNEGMIYLTLAANQGERSAWDIEGIAQRTGLSVIKGLPFSSSNIEGYEPKRAYSDERIIINQTCTYVLCLRNDCSQIREHNERKLELKRKYFLELHNISSTRRDLYNTCFTLEQAFELLEEEIDFSLNQFWRFYWKNYSKSQTKQMDTFKKICKFGIMKILNFFKRLSYEEHFSVEDICVLLKGKGDIDISQFREVYKTEFGKRPLVHRRDIHLVETLEILSNIGNFYVEERPDGSNHLVAECSSAEIQELLKECGGELQANNFRELFKNKYGRAPFSDRVKMKDALENVCHSGRFLLEMRGTSLWIIIRYCTAEEIYELLTESDGDIYVGLFRDIYEQKFGRPPFPDGSKLKDALEKLSHSGTFQLETRRGGLWITPRQKGIHSQP